ncbi:cob(I)yrinic acid a,c-diamide adenosyltransferase [Leyella lascolaii]|uniref:Corrinoid adenosyltransferase n=1 Tax=Leyella lascolaii TaxID=1776379 RepID=A0AAW7JGT6_9BACT|nr:cob(I)yrinic acid a,c-diamide adenosyltransferase [Leyella lascolaii]MDN0023359.1 cob(I)yrinic acid a,c-diamide adenosyltransferase [Leyella lascolaii]MDN0024722.1 cob(I)yrinic acid a,c-diamide adenosyltransferase [Leyella lascolaii]
MKIYTRTGDTGLTDLPEGHRVPKTDVRIEFYGTVDELNCFLGILVADMPMGHDRDFVERIQHALFTIGVSTGSRTSVYPLQSSDVLELEREIDAIESSLPRFNGFVLPGGCAHAARCHVCRSVCRRLERRMLALELADNYKPSHVSISYVNRLSDYLFVLAKKLNYIAGVSEKLYVISRK